MIRRTHHFRRRLQPGINLTPMLDVLFNLIFFFILATTIRSDMLQMPIDLPEAESGRVQHEPDPVPIVNLDEQGRVFFMAEPLDLAQLEAAMQRLAARGEREILIRGDRRVDYGRVVAVMDACKRAGIDAVLLDLRRRPEPEFPTGSPAP